jgi:hypothetical protein
VLICPFCEQPIDPSGRGVASHHPDHDPERGWASRWVPFIGDLRGSPTRLVHSTCFADAEGAEALAALVQAHDEIAT